MIHVFVADDHAIVRDGLSRILEATPGMTCVGTSEDARGTLARARVGGIDALVLDLSLPGGSGLEVLGRLCELHPGLGVVVYSMHPEEQYGLRALKLGAKAYVAKGRPTTTLIEAIRAAAAGERFVTPELAALLLEGREEEVLHDSLSDREFQVFKLLVEGRSPADISRELHVAASTVSTHLLRVKQKLRADSTADLVRYAVRSGLLEP